MGQKYYYEIKQRVGFKIEFVTILGQQILVMLMPNSFKQLSATTLIIFVVKRFCKLFFFEFTSACFSVDNFFAGEEANRP